MTIRSSVASYSGTAGHADFNVTIILNATAIGLHDGIRRLDDQRTGCHSDASSAGKVPASPCIEEAETNGKRLID